MPDRHGKGQRKEKGKMLRAMDSAVAGLRSHQNKMDVVGHNIANVNTFGFKAQTYTFKEAMYQTSTASTGGGNTGGVNASQFGYGTLMGSIGMDMTASTPSYVGGFNASIDGEGFFATSPSKLGGITGVAVDKFKDEDFDYTRVGQFLLDSDGYVVDANGNYVYGFRAQYKDDSTELKDGADAYEKGNIRPLRIPLVKADKDGKIESCEISDKAGEEEASQSITIEINNVGEITATVRYNKGDKTTGGPEPDKDSKVISIGKVALITFQNPNGLTKAGGNYYKAKNGDNTGQSIATVPGDSGTSTLMGGFIEASNVDLAKEFSDMITTHRGFQANSKMITVSDEMLSDLVSMKR